MAFIRSETLVSMAVPAGQTTIEGRIPACGSGLLFSLLANQTGGTLDGFTVELFSKSAAVTPNYPVGDVPAVTGSLTGPATIHRAIAPLVVGAAADGAAYVPNGQPFYNSDSSISNRQDYLWFKITPVSNITSKLFSLLITYSEADQ